MARPFPQAPAADPDRLGKNDKIFPAEGAAPYLRDLSKAELHLLDTGHFALEEESARIGALMRDFLQRTVVSKRS